MLTQHAKELQQAQEHGIRLGRKLLIQEMEDYCNQPYHSAAFPNQEIKQGKVKTALQLLEYIKGKFK